MTNYLNQQYKTVILRPRYRKLNIPMEWDIQTLSNICTLINGIAFKPTDWKKKGLPIIRIQNLNNEKAEFNYYDKAVPDKYYINNNDILFGWSGNLGTSFGAFIWKRGKAILNQHIFKVIPNNKINKLFLFYILNQLVKDIELETHGSSGLVHVRKGYLENRMIPIPPLKEQQKIASILLYMDELLQKLNRIIELTQTLKKALINKLVTNELELKENLNSNISSLYRLVKLTDVVEINPSYELEKSKEYEYVEMAAINEHTKSINYYSKRKPSSGYSVFKNKDTLFARITPCTENGKICLVNNINEYGLGSTELIVLSPKKEILPEFLCYYCQTDKVRNHAISQMGGATGRQRVPYKVFTEDLFVSLPSKEIQEKNIKIISSIEKLIQLYTIKKDRVQILKKGLMQQLLTGKIRVKV